VPREGTRADAREDRASRRDPAVGGGTARSPPLYAGCRRRRVLHGAQGARRAARLAVADLRAPLRPGAAVLRTMLLGAFGRHRGRTRRRARLLHDRVPGDRRRAATTPPHTRRVTA